MYEGIWRVRYNYKQLFNHLQWCRTGGGGGAGGATAPPLLKVGGGSAPPPPLFGHVCTLNERKGFLLQYVSHKC